MVHTKIAKFMNRISKRYNVKPDDITDILDRADDDTKTLKETNELTERYFRIQRYKGAPKNHYTDIYSGIVNAEINNNLPFGYVQRSWENYKKVLRTARLSEPKLYPCITRDYHSLCKKVIDYKHEKRRH